MLPPPSPLHPPFHQDADCEAPSYDPLFFSYKHIPISYNEKKISYNEKEISYNVKEISYNVIEISSNEKRISSNEIEGELPVKNRSIFYEYRISIKKSH